MNIIAELSREHRLFERLTARLHPHPELEDDQARARIVEALLVLLPALDRHDRLEETVFSRPEAHWPKDAELVHRLAEAQHDSLRALRSEIAAVLASQLETRFSRLAALADLFAEKLKWHLQTEELLLWPLYAKLSPRSIDHSAARQAAENAAVLKRAVERLAPGARFEGAA
jgi:hypothetical protein